MRNRGPFKFDKRSDRRRSWSPIKGVDDDKEPPKTTIKNQVPLETIAEVSKEEIDQTVTESEQNFGMGLATI